MADILLVVMPWASVFVGFVLLNWFAVSQLERRLKAKAEEQNDRLGRIRKAINALRDSRSSSRDDRIDRL
jgi:hypothetical protein